MNLDFHPKVQREIRAALRYYAARSPGAADRFWDAVQDRLRDIRDNPHRFGFHHEGRALRGAKLRKYPYCILYRVNSRGVRVTCVKHDKRRPLFGIFRR